MNISFSFIMPAYKALYLHSAIESILNQEYKKFELIIINDASPENLFEIVNHFSDKRIRYEKNIQNIGGTDLVKNWNYCIKFANNEYIILASDDDIYEPQFLIKAIALIEKYPDVNIIRSGVKRINEQGQILDIEFPLKEFLTAREFALYYAKGGTISCVSNYIFRKKALLDNGGFIPFPKAHYSDDATSLALSYKGVACIPSNEFNFRVSNINLSNHTDLDVVCEQLKATELYMTWFLTHINSLNHKEDFFEKACYGGYKQKYLIMIGNLINKIPLLKILLVAQYIFSNKHLFKKEKYRLLFDYIINKF